MGIAALGILLCHASGNGVQLPSVLNYIFGLGNFGVDLFLLLSGFSMYHSLRYFPKSESIVCWYNKRFFRLLVPYLILSVPYWAYICILENASITDFLYYVSTAVYWIEHRGAWFIALIIPLYLLSPIFMRICTSQRGVYYVLALIAIICVPELFMTDQSCHTLHNILFVLKRVPFFLLGFIAGRFEEEKIEIKSSWVLLLCVGFAVCYKMLQFFGITIYLLLPILVLGVLLMCIPLISNISLFNRLFVFMGGISLESYLTNIYLGDIFRRGEFDSKLLCYLFVVALGILLSVVTNKLSTRIIKSKYN
ncbi:MAG: acyltransferase [Tidjanibacter sp.]|nr:acyltransferase [Tidjanibacter sp.]